MSCRKLGSFRGDSCVLIKPLNLNTYLLFHIRTFLSELSGICPPHDRYLELSEVLRFQNLLFPKHSSVFMVVL